MLSWVICHQTNHEINCQGKGPDFAWVTTLKATVPQDWVNACSCSSFHGGGNKHCRREAAVARMASALVSMLLSSSSDNLLASAHCTPPSFSEVRWSPLRVEGVPPLSCWNNMEHSAGLERRPLTVWQQTLRTGTQRHALNAL